MVTALILSGGTGVRLGGNIPKQYIEVNNKMIIEYSIESLADSSRIDAVWFVVADEWKKELQNRIEKSDNHNIQDKIKGYSEPGDTRQLSIYNGIKDIQKELPDTDYVFVHDAARPFLSKENIADVIDAAAKCDGAMPVLPMKDTVYLSENGKFVTGLLNRSQIYAGQAPEVFKLDKYIEANEKLIEFTTSGDISEESPIYSINGSSEPAVMAGMNIALIAGDERNFKITTRADLERFMEIIKR